MKREDFEKIIESGGQKVRIFDINRLETTGVANIGRLPFSIKILVENLMRKLDGRVVTEADLITVARWERSGAVQMEIPFHPARVLMQDFTGVPAVVDLAAMRDAMKALGGDPKKINPLVPVDLIVDHSVQVDYFGTDSCREQNVAREYERNGERYSLLKWAQKSFANFRVVPPRSGICHQVNLEHLSQVFITADENGQTLAYPDTLVGLDSHTTMINGIGVVGWGVGGIEAEAVMLGQPYYMSIPEVIGVRFSGALNRNVTATDLVLHITEMLREYRVVEKFVEFFGPGLKALSAPDRATVSNMSPEYGATIGFFPVDKKTISYLKMTNRAAVANIVEACTREMGLFYTGDETPEYTDIIDFDLTRVTPSVAGPARPQDRIELGDLKDSFARVIGCVYERDMDVDNFSTFIDESGCETERARRCIPVNPRLFDVSINNRLEQIGDGSVVIAAITSCTNTSNPAVLIGAALLARNGVKRGLKVPAYVKTSLAPGSKVVVRYLEDAGFMPYLEALGFYTTGFGCTTCIGNSGPLKPEIESVIEENDLNVAAVLSGNRNFEARIHQRVKSNFLASPILVVAFALAGRIDTNFKAEPVGIDPNGEPVYLDEIWPKADEIRHMAKKHLRQQFFKEEYGRIFDGDDLWRSLEVTESTTYNWVKASTYIKHPPYFDGFSRVVPESSDLTGIKALAMLGDTVTTDHISPAGAIPESSPAGAYLVAKGVAAEDFNSYGSRRGNHEVMMRGTFGNIRIKNRLVAPKEGGFTKMAPEDTERFIYDAARACTEAGTPLLVLGGREYGTGSSRDWAAKGTRLLGVRAVIARSFERIHRSNLVGMGVLPLMFLNGDSYDSLGLDGFETFSISGVGEIKPRKRLAVVAEKSDGIQIRFKVLTRLDTDVEVSYFCHGGILPFVLRKLLSE